jgi:two-component system NtrC family sensor kinase
VLTNLIVNAAQTTDGPGRVKIELESVHASRPDEHGVDVSKSATGLYGCISVSDQGHGIDQQDLQHIFEPFFTTKDVGEGTGLGLSISHGIIQEHEGWIEVESAPDEGSTFKVFLPAGPSSLN